MNNRSTNNSKMMALTGFGNFAARSALDTTMPPIAWSRLFARRKSSRDVPVAWFA